METKIEIWKDIPDYEGLYKASNLGRIMSLIRYHNTSFRLLTPRIQQNKYLMVTLSKNNIKKQISIHRLVALTFIPNPENKKCVNHIDGNKQNNILTNLEWVTNRENSAHHFLKQNYSSSYVGVHWNKDNNKWRSSIRLGKKLIHLGYFYTEQDASIAYGQYKKQYNIS